MSAAFPGHAADVSPQTDRTLAGSRLDISFYLQCALTKKQGIDRDEKDRWNTQRKQVDRGMVHICKQAGRYVYQKYGDSEGVHQHRYPDNMLGGSFLIANRSLVQNTKIFSRKPQECAAI